MNEGVAGARAMNEGVGVVFPHLDLLWSRHCTVRTASSACTWMHTCFNVNTKGSVDIFEIKESETSPYSKRIESMGHAGGCL